MIRVSVLVEELQTPQELINESEGCGLKGHGLPARQCDECLFWWSCVSVSSSMRTGCQRVRLPMRGRAGSTAGQQGSPGGGFAAAAVSANPDVARQGRTAGIAEERREGGERKGKKEW